ncbi:MAG: 3-oxoacyl-ACP synthase [Clostridia bacterium]|nr:3-oxoacyl-ACP synthase [Clostridia bacterium]
MLREIYNAGIIGIGLNMPEEIRKNNYWNDIEIVNSRKEKSSLFVGIEERRIFPDNVPPSDFETVAAKRAIKDAGLELDDIDLVMVHSMLQDKLIPGNASLLQHKLGLRNAGAWNMDTCCSSFVSMLIAASHLIMMGTCKNIVIATSILHSRMISPTHYLSTIVGDGAAAVVMSRVSEGRGFIASNFHSKGEYHDAFTMREVAITTENGVEPSIEFFTNDELVRSIGRNSVNDVAAVVNEAMKKANLNVEEIDFMISHQPSPWAHGAWRDAIGLTESKSYESFSRYGNLASTSIPVNLFEARELGKLKDDDTILLVSPGAGENFAVAFLKWGK